MILNPKSDSGGVLLFAIITAFVIAFTSATLTALTLHQAKITIVESERMEAMNNLKGGMLYAQNLIYNCIMTGQQPPQLVNWNGLTINILEGGEISTYRIEVKTEY